MIRRLRRKFILICMISVFVVMFAVVALINGINAYRCNVRLDNMLTLLANNNGVFPNAHALANEGGRAAKTDESLNATDESTDKTDESLISATGEPPSVSESGTKISRQKQRRWNWDWNADDSPTAETPFMTRHFSVQYDEEGQVICTNMDSIAAVSEEEAIEYADDLLGRGQTSGVYGLYRYRVTKNELGTLVTFLDASNEMRSGSQLLLISSGVAFLSLGAVFVLVLLLSRRAVLPITVSIEKQKQFITDAGHELKTPLTIISANCEILGLNLGKNEWLTGIENQTTRLRKLVNNLVTLSRLDEERPAMARTRFSLSDAVYDTAMTFSTAAERAGKRLDVLVEPNVFFTGDEASVRQLTSILLDNAVKYCDAGGEVSVAVSGGKHPVLAVENTCENVDSLAFDRLFDRFYRADSARTNSGSYGLGLSIARSIAEAHRASVRAEKAGENRLRMRVRF